MEDPPERSVSGNDSVEQDKYSDSYDSEDDKPPEESEEPNDTTQNVPAAVYKLYDFFNGEPHPPAQSRTRSDRSIDHENSSIGFCRATHYDVSPPKLMRGASDTTGEFGQPTKSVRQLGSERATMREAQASPEWPYWRSAIKREMDGQIARGV